MIPLYWSLTWNGLQADSATRTITAAWAVFTVPRALGKTGEVAYWLGVGGQGRDRRDLCQAGISVGAGNADGLIAEDWPTPPKGGVPVQPGNTIRVQLAPQDQHRWWRITATDTTTHVSLSVGCRVPVGGGWNTVEVIGEEGATPLRTTPVVVHWGVTGLTRPRWMHWMVPIPFYSVRKTGPDTLRLVA